MDWRDNMDPISDMFIRIKNAGVAGHESVRIPYSKFKYEIARVLERNGFVGRVERKGKRIKKILEIPLISRNAEPAIANVTLISKPSRRLYTPCRELRSARHGGAVVLSTQKGVLTGAEARKEKVGGELIAEVW